MILAMSTITGTPGNANADSRIKESDIFYQRGLALCGSEILRGTTPEVGMASFLYFYLADMLY